MIRESGDGRLNRVDVEAKLRQVAHLQRRRIPPECAVNGLDTAIGYEPKECVSGDYPDSIHTPDGRTLLALADVSGHDAVAAGIALSLHAFMHGNLRGGVGLPELANGLNDYLCEYSIEGSFATMVCLLIDPETGHIEYFNAGHPSPIVVEPCGRVRRLKDGVNLPLGIGPGPVTCDSYWLERAELLAVFSDGWSELKNGADERVGFPYITHRLRSVYTSNSAATVREIKELFEREFYGSEEEYICEDDRTLLLARRN